MKLSAEIRLPKDKDSAKVFTRKIRDVDRKSGVSDSVVGLPKEIRDRVKGDGADSSTVLVGLVLENEVVFFDHAGLAPLKCPFCGETHEPDQVRMRGSLWSCVCGAVVNVVPPKVPYPFEPYDYNRTKTAVVHNFDSRSGKVVTVLPVDAGRLRPDTGLLDVVFRKFKEKQS